MCLFFIPLGALFEFKYIGVFIIAIIALETAQYLFHLGFFDIGDIITNTIGFKIGNIAHHSLNRRKIVA